MVHRTKKWEDRPTASRQQVEEIFRPAHAALPDGRQCAMLVAYLFTTKQSEAGKEVTRARLTENTLRRIFVRQRITPEFLLEVQEWLLRAGWALFPAGESYAAVKVRVVSGWGLISSKRIADELRKVAWGQFDFSSLETLLLKSESAEDDDD